MTTTDPALEGDSQVEIDALFMNLKSTAKQVVKFIPEMPKEA